MFFYDGNYLYINNFTLIEYVEINQVIVVFEKLKLIVKGDTLLVNSLYEEEVIISGRIKEIKLEDIF